MGTRVSQRHSAARDPGAPALRFCVAPARLGGTETECARPAEAARGRGAECSLVYPGSRLYSSFLGVFL